MCERGAVGGHACVCVRVCARECITQCSRKAQIICWSITCGDSSNVVFYFTVAAQVNLSTSPCSTRQRHARHLHSSLHEVAPLPPAYKL